jgi:tetratricopeptide (TPR) repeat protein
MKEVRQGLLEDAAALYTDLIALNPRDAQAYHERGSVHYLLTRFDQARADYERAAAMAPDNAEYHGTLATFFDLGISGFTDKQRSLYHARRMAELRPADAQARGTLGVSYHALGQTNEAVAEYRKAAELARGTALEHKLLAMAEYAAGDTRKAIAQMQQARELPPPDLWVYWRLTDWYEDLGEDEQALATVEEGLRLALRRSDEPDELRARWRGIQAPLPTSEVLTKLLEFSAGIHMRQKKYAAAVADYSHLSNVAMSTNSYHYKQRALAHFHLGHYKDVLADLARAVEIKPDNFSNLTWISPRLVASCPDAKFRAGLLALAAKAIERTPGKLAGYVGRGQLYAALKQYDKARADFERAVELGATNANLLNNVAWYWATAPEVEFRDPKRAVTLATRAVGLDPNSWTIWNTLGVAHYRAGDCRDAVVALEKSSELRGNGDRGSFDWFFLAMAHCRLGDREQARTWYDKAVARMDKSWRNPQEEEELKRFRAEAAALLGIKEG